MTEYFQNIDIQFTREYQPLFHIINTFVSCIVIIKQHLWNLIHHSSHCNTFSSLVYAEGAQTFPLFACEWNHLLLYAMISNWSLVMKWYSRPGSSYIFRGLVVSRQKKSCIKSKDRSCFWIRGVRVSVYWHGVTPWKILGLISISFLRNSFTPTPDGPDTSTCVQRK